MTFFFNYLAILFTSQQKYVPRFQKPIYRLKIPKSQKSKMKDFVMPFFSLAEYEKLLNKLIYVKRKLAKDF